MLPVRRVVVPDAAVGVELSETKLQELIALLHDAADVGARRTAMRVPVEGFVHLQALSGDEPARVVGVYDMSRSGIAIVDREAMAAGKQFNLLFPREGRRPIEVMCTTRHSRRQGEGHIIGAEFGVSWLSALSAAI